MLYFLALFSLSTAPNWAKLNLMPAEVLGFWRLIIAFGLLSLFSLIIKKENIFKVTMNTKWVLMSGVFFFLHLWTYKWSSKHNLVSNTMILFATNPIWSSLGGVLFFKEKIEQRMILSYLLAFLGIGSMVWDQVQMSPENHFGNILALLSALFYAIYMLLGKKARQTFSNTSFASLQYLTAGVLFGLSSVAGHKPLISITYDWISWISVFGLVFLPTFLGHFSLTYLLKTMNIGIMTCGKLIEPIIASILAYFIFNEHLGRGAPLAFLLTAASVLILFYPEVQKVLLKRKS